jgi:hypothetical protein
MFGIYQAYLRKPAPTNPNQYPHPLIPYSLPPTNDKLWEIGANRLNLCLIPLTTQR